MEEKEKKPWRPPEAAHLPDPIAYVMQGFGGITERTADTTITNI